MFLLLTIFFDSTFNDSNSIPKSTKDKKEINPKSNNSIDSIEEAGTINDKHGQSQTSIHSDKIDKISIKSNNMQKEDVKNLIDQLFSNLSDIENESNISVKSERLDICGSHIDDLMISNNSLNVESKKIVSSRNINRNKKKIMMFKDHI